MGCGDWFSDKNAYLWFCESGRTTDMGAKRSGPAGSARRPRETT